MADVTDIRELPVIGCGLDDSALEAQLGRYRALGAHVARAERSIREVAVTFAATVDRELLAETVATERGCCPFFEIDAGDDSLRMSVTEPDREPALAAVADALGA